MKYKDKYPDPVSGQELPDGIVWAHNREHWCKGPGCRKRTHYRCIKAHGWFCSEECRRAYCCTLHLLGSTSAMPD